MTCPPPPPVICRRCGQWRRWPWVWWPWPSVWSWLAGSTAGSRTSGPKDSSKKSSSFPPRSCVWSMCLHQPCKCLCQHFDVVDIDKQIVKQNNFHTELAKGAFEQSWHQAISIRPFEEGTIAIKVYLLFWFKYQSGFSQGLQVGLLFIHYKVIDKIEHICTLYSIHYIVMPA